MNWEEDQNRRALDRNEFISRATNVGKDTTDFREYLANYCVGIHTNVVCAHGPPCAFHLLNTILINQDVPGPIVECGCFKGGMSCKLSIVAEELGKELYVFDSFRGLPHDEETESDNESFKQTSFQKGQYHGRLVEFEMNMALYGRRNSCRVVEGFFENTLHLCDIYPSFVFIDVDLTTSAKTCIEYFWPRLQGTHFYTHEAVFKSYMNAILDEQWWLDTMKEPPPECVGRNGFKDACCLGYLVKKHGSE